MKKNEIKEIVENRNDNEIIQLLTKMNNRITLLEKQKLDNHIFYDYKRKKKGWFSKESLSYSKKKKNKSKRK